MAIGCGVGDAAAQQDAAAYVVVVGTKSPHRSIGELLQAVGSARGALLCGAGRGVPGCGGLARATGVRVETVPYKARAALVADIADQRLDLGLLTIDDARSWALAGFKSSVFRLSETNEDALEVRTLKPMRAAPADGGWHR